MSKRLKCKDMFERIVDYDNLLSAYKQSLKSDSKYKLQAITFSYDYVSNLEKLRSELINGTYTTSGYNKFTIYEPKIREVQAPKYTDKIVQLAIINVIRDLYQSNFIYDSYACLEDKGTHKAVKRLEGFSRSAYSKWGSESYILKIDIRKFFYSIDRVSLIKIVSKRIYCKRTLQLIIHIINSSPDEIGLPLGNVTSQILANVCMNEVDQYCKRVLGVKYYIRYMDDMVFILPNKETAKEVLYLVDSFITTNLGLTLNKKKTKYFPINQGVNTIGFRIYPTHTLLRSESKKGAKRKIKKIPNLIKEGKLTIEKAEQMLNSWLGHSNYSCNKNLIDSIIENNNYLTINSKGVFKICL